MSDDPKRETIADLVRDQITNEWRVTISAGVKQLPVSYATTRRLLAGLRISDLSLAKIEYAMDFPRGLFGAVLADDREALRNMRLTESWRSIIERRRTPPAERSG